MNNLLCKLNSIEIGPVLKNDDGEAVIGEALDER